MLRRHTVGLGCAALLLGLSAGSARAQDAETHPHAGLRPYAFGGEVTVVASARQDIGFFNNTDYDINATRMARLRLFGEWHFSTAFSWWASCAARTARI
jgi:hypothetical protein